MSARDGPLRVLVVSHTARISGAEHTLLDLLHAIGSDVRVLVASPVGDLSARVTAAGVAHVAIRGTDAGLKLHPIGTPRALWDLARDGLALRAVARRGQIEVVHANSTRAALSSAICRTLGGPPVVVHVHDVLGEDRVSRIVRWVIGRTASVALANSAFVRASLVPVPVPVAVVDNPVDLVRFDPSRTDRDATRRRLGLPGDALVLCVVGQITPWKGQDTAVRALALLPERHAGAVLLLVGAPVFTSGATRHDNRGYEERLGELAEESAVRDRVRFLGPRDDIPEILAASDVALVPSWEEPFGRVVIEAMVMGVPVLATSRGGPAEILRDGGGVLVAPRDPEAWARTLCALLDDPAQRRRLGAVGRARALERYGLTGFVTKVTDAYAVASGAP